MSTITGYLERMSKSPRAPAYNGTISGTTVTTTSTGTGTMSDGTRARLEAARRRNPADYKHVDDGRGKKFRYYCYKCGCNTTHNTNGCYELSTEDKAKYK